MPRLIASSCIALLLLAQSFALAEFPPAAQEHARLPRIIQSDPEAAGLFADIRESANAALHDKPYPIKTIVSEGHLGSDPDRIRTYESLPDLDKIGALDAAYLVTADPKYCDKLREFLLAWAQTNVSEGNPINDTKLEPAVVAYGDIRARLSAADQLPIDHWLFTMAHALIDGIGKRPDHMQNNWQSHRLKIIGLVAFILHDDTLKSFILQRYRQQVHDNLLPDGSCIDFHSRDALHYQCYDLEPLLSLAIAADQNGIDLYDYESPEGASLAKSVAFLVPYCEGTKKHPEFVHSTVDFDRQRAASGDNMYKAGRPFDPHMGIHSLELAAYFDRSLIPLVSKLAGGDYKRYPTWQIVLNEASAKSGIATHQVP